jgi:hypothetical protein
VGEVRRRFLSCDFTPLPHMDAPLSMIILCGRLRRATSDAVGGFGVDQVQRLVTVLFAP